MIFINNSFYVRNFPHYSLSKKVVYKPLISFREATAMFKSNRRTNHFLKYPKSFHIYNFFLRRGIRIFKNSNVGNKTSQKSVLKKSKISLSFPKKELSNHKFKAHPKCFVKMSKIFFCRKSALICHIFSKSCNILSPPSRLPN